MPVQYKIKQFINPFFIFVHLWQFRELIKQLAWREVIGRYKGSFVGLGWSFIHPLLMLCVYTFVFSVIFNARWGVDPEEGRAAFALALFMGMITFGIFSEVVNVAPLLVLGNQNYVKKVLFPLEILPFVQFLSALINAVFQYGGSDDRNLAGAAFFSLDDYSPPPGVASHDVFFLWGAAISWRLLAFL